MVEKKQQEEYTYQQRLDVLRATKLAQTKEKQEVVGSMNHDDWGMILPPRDDREIVQAISTSGMPIKDVLLKGFEIRPNHPSGGFFGPKSVGENFRALMEAHPVYIDPMASLAGAYMVNFSSYRKVVSPPAMDFGDLHERIDKYEMLAPLLQLQHFCQDMKIGLDLGFRGILTKIRHFRGEHGPEKADFYAGLEAVVLGMQNWIQRTADASREMAETEGNLQLRCNLLEMAEMNDWLVNEPPRTFREACQWILWYLIMARMFNGSGSGGRLDVLLTPYYEKDVAEGVLTDEEAQFHVANVLLRDTTYGQLGGPDETGQDVTNRVSYIILEATHRLRIPCNIGVCVGQNVDPGLLHRGVEIQFEDKAGNPKFLGVDNIVEGFIRNDIPVEIARTRAYSGCHWFALPGREYTCSDGAKINLGMVFEWAFKEMMTEEGVERSVNALWERFADHLQAAVKTMADVFDFHVEHKYKVIPELVLDLCCYGPIEKGVDASNHGLEYYNFGLDAAALATVADSFAAIEQRVEKEGRLSWDELNGHLESDWVGTHGERARQMMRSIARYGSGGSRADEWAIKITEKFVELVKSGPTDGGHNMIPGHFSWANTIMLGRTLGATPNGRYAHAPISHGANPDPGFRQDGAPSAMATAIASVQCWYGNSSPMQIELDPGMTRDQGGVETVANLVKTHVDLGGTLINMNVMDSDKVMEAHEDPSRYPDLVVRVTGFSAYFASLSKEFRQLVVDRMIAGS